MHKLIQGIHGFHEMVFAAQCAFFEKLEQGQAPKALFITCADSRVIPSLITQTDPGELFVLRNAGNIVQPYNLMPSGSSATIEYAVEILGVRDIIVCGHTACGAMSGVLDPGVVASFPALAGWLSLADGTRRILRDHYKEAAAEDLLDIAVKENVLVQIEHLRTHPGVIAKLRTGDMCLHAWIYDIAEGQVLAYNPESGQYEPIAVRAMMPAR